MARLVWNKPEDRVYETGVDRGVLYVSGNGVAWNGIIAITESSDGGEAESFYFDGYKYASISSSSEFVATLEAFAAPAEFAQCDGVGLVQNGLFADQQPRKKFGLSYRTIIGNQFEGDAYAYKIHLVYGCLADPSDRAYASIGSDATPMKHSWQIASMPQVVPGIRPTAHFIIDSRSAYASTLQDLEDLIYGDEAAAPVQPTALDLVAMFAS